MDYVKVYKFQNAPKHYQELSGHGGDEDYIIAMSPESWEDYSTERIVDRLTVCDYEQHEVEEDEQKILVFITAHA